MDRRTLTMNWDGLGEDDDDDDRFFETYQRISSAVPVDLASSGSDDDDGFEDGRMSFVSAVSSLSVKPIHNLDMEAKPSIMASYDMWMAEPGDIKERRKRLLKGMGLASNKDLVKLASPKFVRAISSGGGRVSTSNVDSSPSEELKVDEPSPSTPNLLVRSRSDSDIDAFSARTKQRKEELIGPVSKQRLTRTSSGQLVPITGLCPYANSIRISPKRPRNRSSMPGSDALQSVFSNAGLGSFFLIKNLDTGKEFIVKEANEEGMWNKLSEVQTGKQLTMEEFEKSVGYSPVVKELMQRANVSTHLDYGPKIHANSYFSKSFRNSKRRGVAFLKGVANSMSGLIVDKEREHISPVAQRANKNSSQWVKVRQHGKSYKEFTALHLSQEIQAHEGSIWTIKFSWDSRFLASAGEDRIIRVWEVQECEVRSPDDLNSFSGTIYHPMGCSFSDRPSLAEIMPMPSEKRKKGRIHKKKGNSIPDYVTMPETVFALSEKPICILNGHQDDILDLSWSRSQLLLSSSMDKTVRLWDLETRSCLKMFAHNDYVTCIQFNPIDDDYFISGSLDGKVRVWSIPGRQVVDWTDLHEMVTAACYTPDGKGAMIGSHKGSCRLYSINDCKLEKKDQYVVQSKKKPQSKKITGFQFSPWNPADVLVTSADSRIRIFSGSQLIQKFRGFRNTSSQISASFSSDGKYVLSASEDSHVYIWKLEESRGKGRSKITVLAHEHFHSKEVSVAIPWNGSTKIEPPIVEVLSKRHHSKRFTGPLPYTISRSPSREDNVVSASSRRHLPPLPKKKNAEVERITSHADEDFVQSARIDSGIGTSESLGSSIRYGESPSISASGNSHISHSFSLSSSSSSSWFDGGTNSHGAQTVQATAWGMVIVTAGLGGEIRVYQNFGLPLKVSRQTNLLRDLT
ncbi:WD repeat-containing protein 44-like [Olea europaea var. sylvestris]|uniref:WD repeat-containing protein 44-like n=1 Tax=Olea europaea var. sylvestris TaxID=158386 RepID=UPI000C1CE662|nr:WD repeat-containing protein 44-like [Olea europaea var. sylvestris]